MMFFHLDIGSRRQKASRLIGDIRNDILKALIKEKLANGLTQQELADMLGVSRTELNRSLSGEGELTLRSIADLAWALNREIHFELRESSGPEGQNYFAETSTVASCMTQKSHHQAGPEASSTRATRIIVASYVNGIEE